MKRSSNSNLLIRIGIFVVLSAVLIKFAVYVGIIFAVALAFKLVFLK